MRFQTKLMLAVLLAVALVTGMVISQTEKRVKSTYSRLAEEEFDEQAERFLEIRRARLEAVADSVERLANTPAVRRLFEEDDFNAEALENIEPLARGRRGADVEEAPSQAAAAADRLLVLVDLHGEVHLVGERPFTVPEEQRAPLRELVTSQSLATRQVGYIVVTTDGEAQLVELVAAPVMRVAADADSGARGGLLGAVVMGKIVNPAGDERRSTPLKGERGLKGAKAAGSGRAAVSGGILGGTRRRLYAGILADGVLFAGTLPPEVKGKVEALLADHVDELESADPSSTTADFDRELTIETTAERSPEANGGGEKGRAHYRVFCDLLSSGGALPPTYQVVLIPMSQLHADLRDLRLRGSGIGLAAALFGLLLAYIFSRQLARPIYDLASATEEVRAGNFQARVAVRSEDEIGQLAGSFNDMAAELETKEQIRDLLGKVSDEAVAQALIDGRLELGGETREVSIMFCDIRGFTAMTENMSPSDVISLLNEHMTAMTEVVYEHRGVIDKFVGDEIMVIFGAPKCYGDDAENAARCALKLIERRRLLSAETGRNIEVGIGIATGEVVVGCMGSADRLNYTVIGERVNRAARMCGCAGAGEVVVDEQTWTKIEKFAEGAERMGFQPKGYVQPVRAFQLDRMRSRDAGEAAAADPGERVADSSVT